MALQLACTLLTWIDKCSLRYLQDHGEINQNVITVLRCCHTELSLGKRQAPGLVNFVSAGASQFGLTLLAAFTQPVARLFAELCILFFAATSLIQLRCFKLQSATWCVVWNCNIQPGYATALPWHISKMQLHSKLRWACFKKFSNIIQPSHSNVLPCC